MKVFTVQRIILPNVLSKQNFKKITLILLVFLMSCQSFHAYSVGGKSLSSIELCSPTSTNFRSHNLPSYSCSNWNFVNPQRLPLLNKQEKGLLNQITINTVLNASYCTGESSSIVFDAYGVYNAGNKFSVQISNFNGSFASPIVIGFINSVTTGTSNVSFKIPINMPIGNGYRVRIVSSSPVTNSANNGVNIQLTTLPSPSIAVATQIICPGSTANLVATCSSGTVKWYNASEDGNRITNLTVSPTVSTDYFAACEDGVSCTSVRARQIVIVNIPDVLIPPYASSCLNSDLELAVVTDEANLNYSWTGPSGFASTLQNPTITNLTSAKEGVYSVRITNANNCLVTGTTSVSIGTVLQNLNVFGNVTVCFSDTINLNASASGASGMNYAWSGPNSYTSNGQNMKRIASVIDANNTVTYHNGLYTLVANNAVTGCTGTTSVDITVGNRPNVSTVLPVGNVCAGVAFPFNLTVSGANFQRYFWTGPNNFTATATAICDGSNNCNDVIKVIPNFSQINIGTYSLTASFIDENSLTCTLKATKNFAIKPSPDVSITSNSAVCLGDALLFNTTYNPSITAVNSFSWTGPNNFTSNLQNPVIYTTSILDSGIYKLIAVGANSCVATVTSFANIVESFPPTVQSTTGVVLSSSITLVATGCKNGTLNWYKSSDNLSVSMPISPIVATSYYSKCNVSGCLSGKSGDILVSILPPVAISVKTGNWEDKATWSIARVPLPIDSVIIRPTHYVTINSQAYAKWLAWSGFGNLIFASSSSKLNLFGNPITTPPVLSSNPVIVVEGTAATFTATGSDIISWYKNGVNLNISGLSYTVNQPIAGDIYTTKRTLNEVISVASNAITVKAIPTPPVLSSNPSNVVENTSVTFTASGSGTISWYKNGVNLNASGNTYTVNQPVAGDVYTAKKIDGGVSSGVSNAITVNSTITITPPILTSNPSNVTENISVSFTAIGPGVFSWYKNGVNLNNSGNTYTVSQPVSGDVYTVKRTDNSVTSGASNAITVASSTQPPVLTSNPVSVVENISVTFVATGSGVISWYKNGVNLNISGNTYTISQPVSGDVYTIKGTNNGVTSGASNAITVASSSMQPPVLDSNPVSVVENISVTFVATGSGVISWYKNGVNLNISGNTYTVGQPVKNDVYTVKRTSGGVTSGASNAITVISSTPPPSSTVVITEPNKPPYYFSDGHPPSHYDGNLNLPAIFTNQPRYDPVNDLVWLKNDKIKIGINLKRGGQLAWASLIDATTNLVYNGYDGGFQVTLDAYQRKDGYTQGGEVSGSGNPGMPTSYNVTHGGDYLNHSVSLIDYHSVPNGFYVKLRPIHYPLNAKFSETYIEATYTIIGRTVKIDYRYTSFRTDGQWDGGGFDGAGAPACFIVNTLNKYKTFTGNSPWSFLPTEGGNLPIQNNGQNPVGVNSTEYWGMVYDQNNPNSGIGIYNATNGGNSTYFSFKQLEVYAGNGPGTEFTSGFTFFQPFIYFDITNRSNYVKDITAYMMIGSELEIRSEVYKISGHEANIPRF